MFLFWGFWSGEAVYDEARECRIGFVEGVLVDLPLLYFQPYSFPPDGKTFPVTKERTS